MIELDKKFLDRYLIEKQINENIFSGVAVWKAMDEVLDSEVAIKEIKIDRSREKKDREGAIKEARLMFQLRRSPYILNLIDVKSDDNAVYLIMDYAAGGNLRDVLKRERGRLPEDKAKSSCIEICKGVAYAHDRDIMHRDLKPENILFDEGIAKIGDFGIARVLAYTAHPQNLSAGVGTSMYIAPEQFDDKYDRRVDLWAIGIILYEMLVGKPPFTGKTPAQITKQILFNEPEVPAFINEPFRTVIQEALQKKPDDRYQTADEIIEHLETSISADVEETSRPKKAKPKGRVSREELPKEITGKDGAEMVLIPAGEFQMGSDDGESHEKPVHPVYLDAFYMDKYEVTNEKYAEFLNEYGKITDSAKHKLIDLGSDYRLIEKSWSVYRPKSGYENHPVICVTWYGAAAYAQYYGKRLPTEAEWEKAARGGLKGKKYPWGDEALEGRASFGGKYSLDGMKRTLKPVGSFSPNGYGLYDMAGNVWEWCADEYDENYYSGSPQKNPQGQGVAITFINDNFTNVKTSRVCRGGSWRYGPSDIRVARRYWDSPADCNYNQGFRCCVSSPSFLDQQ